MKTSEEYKKECLSGEFWHTPSSNGSKSFNCCTMQFDETKNYNRKNGESAVDYGIKIASLN